MLLGFVFLISCGHGRTAHNYKIGLGPWVGFGPFYLAQQKGFFENAGLKVDLIVLTGLSERNSAMKSGRIDGLAAPVDYFVLSAGNNLSTRIVMAVDESSGGDGIVAKPGFNTFQDLRGKRVAFQRGLPSEFFLRAMLLRNGMQIDQLKAVDIETAQAGAAFIANQLDAAGLWEPWLTKAKEEGHGHILASTREYPNLIVDCLAFNNDIVAKSPDDVQKIVNSVLKAIDYWKQHPEESNGIMAPFFQVDTSKYATILSGAKFCDLARNRAYFGSALSPGDIFGVAKQASQIWKEAGVIRQDVSPESVIDLSFITHANE